MSQKEGKAAAEAAKGEVKGEVVARKGRLEPVRSFEERFDEMEQMMDRLFGGFLPSRWMRPLSDWQGWPSMTQRAPAADVLERDGEILVRAEVPGLKKEDISISVNGNVLQIEGRSRTEEKEEKGEYRRREITSTAFSRSLWLPAEVNVGRAKASLKDGLLEITLPKAEEAQAKKIAVEA